MTQTRGWTKILRSTALHVGFAFVAMGAWAAFVNRDHGQGAAALAFLVQGGLSGLITLVMKRFLEDAAARTAPGYRRVVPPLITAGSILTLLTLAHMAAGTPELLATIALPWTVSTTYAFVHVALLPLEGSKS